jgi:ParB/RepB/Spo0J family partition protein
MQDTLEESAEADIETELLPAEYDRLISADLLVHGEHNPRRVRPSSTLRRSIERRGLNRPLIVRPDPDSGYYHITDGWQRYQAATDCGWESLPVRIFDSPLDALEATEVESIVREWSTYEWAQYCRSLATEIEAGSRQQRVEQIAELTDKARSPYTIRKYLDVLELPDDVHPLLVDGPVGDTQSWQALRNHNPDVRQYGGLSWQVAAQLSRAQPELSHERVLGIAAWAVTFDTKSDAQEFVATAAEQSQRPLGSIRKEVLFGQQHTRYLEVPRTHIRLTRDEKQAIMDYCAENKQSLTDIVAGEIQSLVDEISSEKSG